MTELSVSEIPIAAIQVSDRYRKEFGDIAGLAASIESLGLLQPIGVDPDRRLVFGQRRLQAFKHLGRTTIPARVIDVPAIVLAEHAENEIRKDFTVSERVEIGKAVEQELKAQGERRGRPKQENENQGELVESEIPQKFAELAGKETREIAADKAGFGNAETYRQAKAVVATAAPELVAAMDREEVAISTAAKLATAPVEVQRQAAAHPNKAVELAKAASQQKAKEIRQTAKDLVQAQREIKEQTREARREENRAIIQNTTALESVAARFATIAIDPPWDWGDEGDVDQMGRARPDYATLPYEKLLALPVADKADTDCHLYLWITNRSLPKGFALLEAWGFRYITCLTWIKPSFGMGNYFRGQSEQVLFGVKGSQPLKRKDASTVFHAPRGPNGHSSKPTEFYDLVESWSPGPYLEIFSRTSRTGWSAWGESA
jgi:N6-adenosine-specific RNA methylase IME4/ParB-like chromosome segregation protein Spo0J